jgi:hypothetical protein
MLRQFAADVAAQKSLWIQQNWSMSDKAKFRIGGLCILEAFLLFGSGMTLMNQEYVNLGAA